MSIRTGAHFSENVRPSGLDGFGHFIRNCLYSQTKNKTFYQVKNKPIIISDIPGFENEKTDQDVVQKFQKYREKKNALQGSIHLILHFLNFT